MPVKRKDKENHPPPPKSKKAKPARTADFSDDENLSDIEDDGEVFNGIRIPAALPPVVSAEENHGPRMVIKEIIANNFKSYYGEVKIGPFHQSLSCIVGANGSGKSNVIDSLLFVFGYRSTKIRSKKVSVLLHKSDRHKDVQQCSVTVHFMHIQDDSTQDKGFVEIPDSEITIMRTAFKDNSSFYTLNNKRAKFKDIAVILKKNGIDLIHNRFLILQGEVEQIAMMKPKAENEHSTGMLEYLEDVIGTVRYKKPIAKLEEKAQELSLNKNEKIARVKALGKEREELVEPVEDVIRLLKLLNQLARLESKRCQKEIYEDKKSIKTGTENRNSIKEKLNIIEIDLKSFAESKKKEEKVLRELHEKLKSDVEKHHNLENKSKSIKQADNKLKADIDHTNAQIKKCENSIKQEQKKITKAKDVPKIKEAECEILKSQLAPLEEECNKLEANYTEINSSGYEKSKKFREEKDELAPEELRLQKLVGSKQNKFQTLKTEFEVLLDTEKSERKKLTNLEEQLMKGASEYQENMKTKEKAEADICTSKDSIKDLKKNVEQFKNDEQQMKTNLQNIRQSLAEKRTAYAETTERSRPIKYILSLKDKNEIPGLLGRCGDYGQVEGKFDIPASTACGSTDQIVVKTTKAAHECIHRLRTNNIGRLTFSILPQIQFLKSRADANNHYPENAKRVFDLIKILDSNFRLTFYSGLYDTLLADNLDQARRIAYGQSVRYRVVTYKGEIIDQSGIISGGGRPIKGKIGPQETKVSYAGGNTSLVSQNEVEKLDKIGKDLEVKLRNTQTSIFDFEASIEKHYKRIEELNMIIRQCSARINAWKDKENQVLNLIEAQKLVIVEKKTDPVAVANKEAEIKKAEKELEKAQVEYDKTKLKMDNLKKKIEEITEGEPKKAKKLLDEATSKLEKTRSAINQVNVDIKAAERQLKNSEGQIETLKKDIDEFIKNIQSYNEKIKQNENKLKELNEQVAEIATIINDQKKNIEEIKNKEDENLEKSNELRKEQITLSQKLESIEIDIEKHFDHQKRCKHTLSKLKLHKIPNINCDTRDPYMECYQNRAITQNADILNEKNDEQHNEQIDKPEKIQSDQVQVGDSEKEKDDDSDSNNEELVQFTDEELEKVDLNAIQLKRGTISESVADKTPNFSLLEEYDKRSKQYHAKADELAEVMNLYQGHVDMINRVRQRRKDEFMASFKKITIKLKEMYQMITLGGDAELELVDSLDPFSEGVNFSVRPPKKTWKVISNLSGGEKTLSSLALVFALHYYKPSPLYVMDEIDAALDFKNVSIIAYYIKERTKNSQFIIISLRSNMFEKADYLVGISKTDDCTQTSYLDVDMCVKYLKGDLANKMRDDQSKTN